MNPKRPRVIALALCALAFLTSGLPAQGLPSGHYETDLTLGPVHLEGRYACFLAEVEAGFITVNAAPTGVLTGIISLLGRNQEYTGSIRSRPNGLRLLLRGKLREGGVVVRAVLTGGDFIGTATVRGKKAPCRIAVSGVGPLRAHYDLDLTTAANGTIAGTGTLRVGQLDIPITARGRATAAKISLTIKNGRTTLFNTTTGKPEGAGFTAAKWTAQGFGALTRGVNLHIAKTP